MVTEISKEKSGHVLYKLEKKWKDYLTPKVPSWLGTKRLTMLSLPLSILVIVFGYLAQNSIHWLWLVSFVIILQYIADTLDGAVGRYRNEGFIKWGYYADKMFDWIFICALIVSYSFILPGAQVYKLIYVLGIYGAFMMHSFLVHATLGEYKIAFFGVSPTEARLALIVANTLLISFGRIYIERALPYILGGAVVAVFIMMYQTQKRLHDADMEAKK